MNVTHLKIGTTSVTLEIQEMNVFLCITHCVWITAYCYEGLLERRMVQWLSLIHISKRNEFLWLSRPAIRP